MTARLTILFFCSILFLNCKKGTSPNPAPAGSLPEVTTSPGYSPFTYVIVSGGTVGREGSSPVTDRGLCWSTSHNPTLADNHFSCGSGLGQFQANLSGFSPGTLYYIRAYATNTTGTAYGNESSALTPVLNVMVGGYEKIGVNGKIGRLWLNGYRSTTSFGDIVRGIAVTPNDFYVLSNETNSGIYFKNSTKYYMVSNPSYILTKAMGITAVGNDIYIVGSLYNPVTRFWEATYWKNGVSTRISDGSRNSYGKAIYVSGSDIYIAWVENSGTDMAKIWHNGSYYNLTSGMTNADVTSIFVSGNDVYAAGSEEVFNGKFIAKYWKNTTATSLTDGTINSLATSVLVSANDVYVTGVQGNDQQAKLWKNGALTHLTGVSSNNYAGGLCLFGSDLYYTGSIGNQSILWKNGNTNLFTDGGVSAVGYCVFVFQ